MKRLLFLLAFLPSIAFAQSTVGTISPFVATTSPANAITQRTYGKAVRLTGLESLSCIGTDANGQLQSGTCSGGGGGTGVATTSFAASFPIIKTLSASSITYSFGGLATTSPWTIGQLAYVADGNHITSVGTSTLSASSPLTGSFVYVGSGGSLGIQAASAAQAGSMAAADWQLLHTATSTFTSPLIYTGSTNAVTLQAASASQTGSMSAGDWQLLHTATTTFTSPLVYTAGTNAVTCPTCTGGGGAYSFTTLLNFATTTMATNTPIWTQGVFFSSSTVASSQFPYASSTALTAGNLFATNLTLTNPLTTANGGSGLSNPGSGAANALIQYAGSSGASAVSPGAQYTVLQSTSGGGGWTPDAVHLDQSAATTGTLPINRGGTNAAAFTTNGNGVYWNNTSLVTAPLTSPVTYPYASSTALTSTTIFGTQFWFTTASTSNLSAFYYLAAPTSTAPTLNAAGQIAVTTTAASSSVQAFSAGQFGLYATTSVSFSWATTTPSVNATDTVAIILGPRGHIFNNMACKVIGASTATTTVAIGSGTATSTYFQASTGVPAPITLTTNNTFQAWQTLFVSIGAYSSLGESAVTCAFGRSYSY